MFTAKQAGIAESTQKRLMPRVGDLVRYYEMTSCQFRTGVVEETEVCLGPFHGNELGFRVDGYFRAYDAPSWRRDGWTIVSDEVTP